jgi:hypothetical protein
MGRCLPPETLSALLHRYVRPKRRFVNAKPFAYLATHDAVACYVSDVCWLVITEGAESHLLGELSRRSQQPRPEVRCGGRAGAVVSGCRHGKPRRRAETFLRSFLILVQVDLLRSDAYSARTLRLQVEVQGVV